jgi:predicted DNA-binding transcriptional regulator YafY
MNKTDRLLAIVLELQRKGTRRAEDLAATFETSVRTIYRDMQALSEAGVPVIGSPGQGYSLMDGYFLPPVSFTPDESVALLLGMQFVEHRFDDDYASQARSARDKITAVLPRQVREEADRVRSSMKLLADGAPSPGKTGGQTMQLLRRAILEERKVHFRYRKLTRDGQEQDPTERTVSPYGLVLVNGSWLLLAHCGLRQEIRHFRLSRLDGLELLDEFFTKPPGFDLAQYTPPDDRQLPVRVRASVRIADKLRESGHFFLEEIREGAEGTEDMDGGDASKRVELLFRVRQPADLLHTVLSWGAEAEVLEPEVLKELVRSEIISMLKSY